VKRASIATALLFVATTAVAAVTPTTPPKWYVARVRHVQGTEIRPACGELYGPFRKGEIAAEFCSHIPTPAYSCTVEPVLPRSEWMRKGAR